MSINIKGFRAGFPINVIPNFETRTLTAPTHSVQGVPKDSTLVTATLGSRSLTAFNTTAQNNTRVLPNAGARSFASFDATVEGLAPGPDVDITSITQAHLYRANNVSVIQADAPQMFANLGMNPAVVFHPGHYGIGNGANPFPSSFLNSPNMVGNKMVFDWRLIEDSTPGSYDWTVIDNAVAAMTAVGKYSMLSIRVNKFGTGDPKTPSYMWNNPAYGGDPRFYGNWPKDSQPGWRIYMENDLVTDRLIAINDAMAARYKSNPWVEGAFTSESSMDQIQNFSATDRNWKRFSVAMRDAWLPSGYVLSNINFAGWAERTYDAGESPEWNLCQYMVENNIGIMSPDLKENNGLLNNGTFKNSRENFDKVVTSHDVQWANYDPPQNTDKTVEEILAFGNGIAFGVVSGSRAALSPKNWIHAWDYDRQPWFSGSPTSPVSGPNTVTVVANRACTLAESFYDSIGQGQYPGDGWP